MAVVKPVPRILFLCTGNSCRSQMAEGLARVEFGSEAAIFSAGSNPKGIDPYAVRAMAEIDIDMSGYSSKHMDDFAGQDFDIVVTVCDAAKEACPYFPGGGKREHRGFDDPPALAIDASDDEEALAHYRRVRDEIAEFVKEMRQWLTG